MLHLIKTLFARRRSLHSNLSDALNQKRRTRFLPPPLSEQEIISEPGGDMKADRDEFIKGGGKEVGLLEKRRDQALSRIKRINTCR